MSEPGDWLTHVRLVRCLREIRDTADAALKALDAGDPHDTLTPLLRGVVSAAQQALKAKRDE